MYNTNIPYPHILITLILRISEDNFYEQHNVHVKQQSHSHMLQKWKWKTFKSINQTLTS